MEPTANHPPIRTRLQERMQFRKKRRQGVAFEDLKQAEMNKQKQAILEKIKELTAILHSRKETLKKTVEELKQRIAALNFTEAGELKNKTLRQILDEAEGKNQEFQNILTVASQELQQRSAIKTQLLTELNALSKLLNKAPPEKFPYQDFVYQAGRNLCQHISHETKRK